MQPSTMKVFGQTFSSSTTVGAALQSQYGMSKQSVNGYLASLGILPHMPLSSLSKVQSMKLTVLGEAFYPGVYVLKRKMNKNIQTLVETSAYRGFRHRAGLPCHGQRTSSNAKTAKKSPFRKKKPF